MIQLILLIVFLLLTIVSGLAFFQTEKLTTNKLIIAFIISPPVIAFSVFLLSFIFPFKPLYLFLIFSAGLLFYWRKKINNLKLKKIKLDWLVLGSLLISLLALTFYSYQQSYNTKTGLTFFHVANAHDSLWHAALQNSLQDNIPPENPIFSGTQVKGYHYFTDLYFALLSSFTTINTLQLAIFYIPLIIGASFVLSNYLLAKTIFNKSLHISLATILLSTYSTQPHLLAWLFPNAKIHPSMFWLDQPATYLINPQLVLSIAILNVIIYFFLKKKDFSIKEIYLLAALIGIKIYSILVILPSFLLSLWQNKNQTKKFVLPIITGLLLLITVLMIGNSSKQTPFFTSPGWFIQQMFTAPDRLNFDTWELQRQHYLQFGSILHLIKHWVYGLIIFLIGNFGLVLLPFMFAIFKNSKKHNKLLLPIILVSITFPLIFLQSGVVWNTIQVLTYARIPLIISILLWLKTQPKLTTKLLVGLIILSLPSIWLTYQSVTDQKLYVNYSAKLISSIKKIPVENKTYVLTDQKLNASALIPAVSNIKLYAADGTVMTILNLNEKNRIEQANPKNCPKDFIYLNYKNDQILVSWCDQSSY